MYKFVFIKELFKYLMYNGNWPELIITIVPKNNNFKIFFKFFSSSAKFWC